MKRFYLSILLSVVVVDLCDAELKTINDFGAAAASERIGDRSQAAAWRLTALTSALLRGVQA